MKEEKEQLLESIEKRVHEVSDENGNISFENFIKLSKEYFGKYSVDNGKTFDEYLERHPEMLKHPRVQETLTPFEDEEEN